MNEKTKKFIIKKYINEWGNKTHIDELIWEVGELHAQIRKIEFLWGITFKVDVTSVEVPKGRDLSESLKEKLEI